MNVVQLYVSVFKRLNRNLKERDLNTVTFRFRHDKSDDNAKHVHRAFLTVNRVGKIFRECREFRLVF